MSRVFLSAIQILLVVAFLVSPAKSQQKIYDPRLTTLTEPKPILADHTDYVAQLPAAKRFQIAPVISDTNPTIDVTAWFYSYNLRGVVEFENRLNVKSTAMIIVHPWSVDDGQGLRTPQPLGFIFFSNDLNQIYNSHVGNVLGPFINKMRAHGVKIIFTLPTMHPVLHEMYTTTFGAPSKQQRNLAQIKYQNIIKNYQREAKQSIPSFPISSVNPVVTLYKNFPIIEATKYNGNDFWKLPIALSRHIDYHDNDVVYFDDQGKEHIKNFLRELGIRHIILGGYATDLCLENTAGGYKNLCRQFDVFVVGDCTLATFPGKNDPADRTLDALIQASFEVPVTQMSWIGLIK